MPDNSARRKLTAAAAADDLDRGRRSLPLVLQLAGWSSWDAVAFTVGTVATAAILVNALWLQTARHPAPLFSLKRPPVTGIKMDKLDTTAARPPSIEQLAAGVTPRPQVAVGVPPPMAPATGTQLVSAIQTELARRGFYSHAIDGLYGPKTDAAIRDFETAAGHQPSTVLDDALLQSIVRAPDRVTKTKVTAPVPRAAPARDQPPAPSPPSPRVVALQRALADYGYGQIKPSGIVDVPTRAAIEKFERERRLPVTGQVSERLVRELAGLTGRPLE